MHNMRRLLTLILCLCGIIGLRAQNLDEMLPIRGLAIEAPSARGVDRFVDFIQKEAPWPDVL